MHVTLTNPLCAANIQGTIIMDSVLIFGGTLGMARRHLRIKKQTTIFVVIRSPKIAAEALSDQICHADPPTSPGQSVLGVRS